MAGMVGQHRRNMQKELDLWLDWYNKERTHSGKYCYGKTPFQTFMEAKQLALEKQVDHLPWKESETFSSDKSLLSNQSEGLANENDSMGVPDQHLSDNKLR